MGRGPVSGGGSKALGGPPAAVRLRMNGTAPRPLLLLAQAAHEMWCERMRQEGWRWGKDYNEIVRTHDALLPFEQLAEEKRRDAEFDVIASGVLDILETRTVHPRGPGTPLLPSTVADGQRVEFVGVPPAQGVVIGCTLDPEHGWPAMVHVRWNDGAETSHPLGAGEVVPVTHES